MNKKLGIILLFIGAYVVLLGGLFWNMNSPKPNTNGYDWFWGLSAGIVIAIGAALAMKKKLALGLVGNGIALLGVVYSIVILFVGNDKQGYFSIWILVGAIITVLGIVFATLFQFLDHHREKVYGKSLM